MLSEKNYNHSYRLRKTRRSNTKTPSRSEHCAASIMLLIFFGSGERLYLEFDSFNFLKLKVELLKFKQNA